MNQSLVLCDQCGAVRWRNGRGLALCPDHGKLVRAWTADDLEDAEPVGRVTIDEIATIDLPEHHDGKGRLVPARTVQVTRERRLRVYRSHGRQGLFVIAGDWRAVEGHTLPAGHVLAAVNYESDLTGWIGVRIRLLRPLSDKDATAVRFDNE